MSYACAAAEKSLERCMLECGGKRTEPGYINNTYDLPKFGGCSLLILLFAGLSRRSLCLLYRAVHFRPHYFSVFFRNLERWCWIPIYKWGWGILYVSSILISPVPALWLPQSIWSSECFHFLFLNIFTWNISSSAMKNSGFALHSEQVGIEVGNWKFCIWKY